MRTMAPEASAPAVARLCETVCPGQKPVYLRRDFDPAAGHLDCFGDVEQRVKSCGGSVQYGWHIWIWPAVLIEAEFHAVWRTPEGELVDISTPPDYASRVLFLPDPDRVYEDRQVNNVRMSLDSNPQVAELIGLSDRIFEEENKGALAYKHGEISLPPEVGELLAQRNRIVIQLKLRSRRLMGARTGRNDPCPCLSGLKYKKCCGRP